MSIKDIRLLEAVSKLIEVATVVEQDVGKGELSEQLRECADTLTNIVRVKEWVR